MSNLLSRIGHRVTISQSVEGALISLAGNRFDLIVSDIGLPDGTGVDFIQKAREKSNIPAVALTGYGMEEDIARCRAAGFNAHLTKPVNFQNLEMLIQQLMARES